jgi:hypothetical protein
MVESQRAESEVSEPDSMRELASWNNLRAEEHYKREGLQTEGVDGSCSVNRLYGEIALCPAGLLFVEPTSGLCPKVQPAESGRLKEKVLPS